MVEKNYYSWFPPIPPLRNSCSVSLSAVRIFPPASLCLPPVCQPFWSCVQETTTVPKDRKKEGQGILAKFSSNPMLLRISLVGLEKFVNLSVPQFLFSIKQEISRVMNSKLKCPQVLISTHKCSWGRECMPHLHGRAVLSSTWLSPFPSDSFLKEMCFWIVLSNLLNLKYWLKDENKESH